jgi:glucose-1-phosphate cytidylyltransferase
MDVLILAGGRGSRLGELGNHCPKALVEVGGVPIIDHVMAHCRGLHGRRIVIAGGYRCADLARHVEGAQLSGVEVIDTGPDSDTGARVSRSLGRLTGSRFLLCWCDALTDLDLARMAAFHERAAAAVTVAAVHPPERFGRVLLDGDRVTGFEEKKPDPDTWISAGYFVVEREAVDPDAAPSNSWERDVLPALAAGGTLAGYRHHGFWQCMDTPHEQHLLDVLARRDNPPWTIGAARPVLG